MATVSAPVKRARRLRPAPLWLSLLLAFLAYFLLDFSLRLFYGSMSNVSLWAWQPLVFTLLWSGTMTAIAALLPRTGRRIFLLVTFVPFVLLAITNCVLYQLTGTCFSFADLAYAGDGARFISASYFRLSKGEWFSLAVCMAMMLCAVIFMPKARPGRRGRIVAAVLAVACAAGIVVVHNALAYRGDDQDRSEYLSWDNAESHDTFRDTYTDFSNPNRCLMLTGLYQYTVRGAAVTLWPQDTATDQRIAELDDYYASHPKAAADTPMTGAFAGKNLIFIMMESMDDWLVTPEYMPNLWRMEQEGLYFPNYYAPMFLSAGTFNSEFTANTGLIAPEHHVRNSYYAEHALPYSLANLFRDAGYSARSYHAANPNIYNRGQIHLNFGYESYNDYGDLGMDDYMLDSQLLRGYDQIVSDEPFFSFIITYSGHGPYTTEQQNISEPHLDRAPRGDRLQRRTVHDRGAERGVHPRRGTGHGDGRLHRRPARAAGGRRSRRGHGARAVHGSLLQVFLRYGAHRGHQGHQRSQPALERAVRDLDGGHHAAGLRKIRQHDGHRADDRGPVLAGYRPALLYRQRYVRPGRRRGLLPQLRVV